MDKKDIKGELSERLRENNKEKIDSMTQYLQEISRYPLLTKEAEIALGQRVQAGDLRAEAELIKSNLRLVVSVAKKYIGRGIVLPDLIQEGNIGLMKAAKRFDPNLNHRFSTYATWWIKQAVLRALAEKAHLIRLPVHIHDLKVKASRFVQKYARTNGVEPSPEEVAQFMEMSVEKYLELLEMGFEITSIHAPVSHEDDDDQTCLIADESVQSPDQSVEQDDLERGIYELLSILTAKEKHVIIRRFALFGLAPLTLQEIGKEMSITRERVRQIENSALNKLKQHPKIHTYKDYLSQR